MIIIVPRGLHPHEEIRVGLCPAFDPRVEHHRGRSRVALPVQEVLEESKEQQSTCQPMLQERMRRL